MLKSVENCVECLVADVPLTCRQQTQHFILESLDYLNIRGLNVTPYLNTELHVGIRDVGTTVFHITDNGEQRPKMQAYFSV